VAFRRCSSPTARPRRRSTTTPTPGRSAPGRGRGRDRTRSSSCRPRRGPRPGAGQRAAAAVAHLRLLRLPALALRSPLPGSGAPDLAREVAGASRRRGWSRSRRAAGWDHGVWVPLRLLYPAADVPVVAVSLPVPRTPELLLAMGRPWRHSGSGASSSSAAAASSKPAPAHVDAEPGTAEPWAAAFSAWVDHRLAALDVDGLSAYASRAPHAALACPRASTSTPSSSSSGPSTRGTAWRASRGFRYGTLSCAPSPGRAVTSAARAATGGSSSPASSSRPRQLAAGHPWRGLASPDRARPSSPPSSSA